MIRLMLALAFGLIASAAHGETPTATPGLWSQSDEGLTLVAARITLPREGASVRFTEAGEASRAGEGLDNMVQYRSADGAVFATVFLYYPGLPHAGLQAYATDELLRSANGQMTFGTARIVAAGGTEGAAILRDYGRYRGSL